MKIVRRSAMYLVDLEDMNATSLAAIRLPQQTCLFILMTRSACWQILISHAGEAVFQAP